MKTMAKEQEQSTVEEYLLSQLDDPVIIQEKDNTGKPTGETTTLKAADGHVMTKQEAIATNIVNMAMKGDVKAAQYIQNIQARQSIKKSKKSKD